MPGTLSVNFDLALDPRAAFDALADEIPTALASRGVALTPGPNRQLTTGSGVVGRVVDWQPGKRIAVKWDAPTWAPSAEAIMELSLDPTDAGTRVTLAFRDWADEQTDATERAGWLAGEILAPAMLALAPERRGNWITDRRARRPSGPSSRSVYRDPLYHYPNFKVILAELRLRNDDRLIDVGCGGGALLKEALKSGCRAAGVDHSVDMVHLATRENQQAVDAGRLIVRQASADRLPFAENEFTCASMTGVLGFLPDPIAAFRELHRVLRPGGRLVVFGSDPALRGTPAAPEPIASRLRFYDDAQFADLARAAGFADANVVRRDLFPFAREAGVPEEHLVLFAGRPSPFLIASKSES